MKVILSLTNFHFESGHNDQVKGRGFLCRIHHREFESLGHYFQIKMMSSLRPVINKKRKFPIKNAILSPQTVPFFRY